MVELPGVDPKMIANNIEPAFATHPGSILKDEEACPTDGGALLGFERNPERASSAHGKDGSVVRGGSGN